MLVFFQGDAAVVSWQAVKIGSVKTGEGLQFVQHALFVENGRIQFDGCVSAENTGTAAGGFLELPVVGGAVRAQKKLCIARGDRAQQCLAVTLALQHRQTVIVRSDTAFEHCIAAVHQVVDRYGRPDTRSRFKDEIDGVPCSDMLEYDFQLGKAFHRRRQNAVDEDFLAVKDIDRWVSNFTVNQKGQARTLHLLQYTVAFADIGDAFIRICRCAGGVEFNALDKAAFMRCTDFIDGGIVGQVQRHQRFEVAALDCSEYTIEVIDRLLDRGYRRFQIGHDDGSLKLFCREWSYTIKYVAITQMEMPVIGAGDSDTFSRHDDPYYVPCAEPHKADRSKNVAVHECAGSRAMTASQPSFVVMLLKRLLEIMLLRRGPQDLPYSAALLVSLMFFYVASGTLVLSTTLGAGQAAVNMALDAVLLSAFSYICLSLLNYRARFVQMVSALAGIGIIYHLLAWPLFLQIQNMQADDPGATISALLMLFLISWQVLVFAHVFRHSMVMSMGRALLLSFGYLFLSMSVAELIFPGN